MLSILSLTLAAATVSADPLAADTLYKVTGSVHQLESDRTPGEAQKTFEMYLFVAERGKEAAKLYWFVEESGRGRWPWPERFGSLTLDAKLKPAGRGPSLLYDREDGTSTLSLVLPFLTSGDGKPLAADAKWSEDSEDNRRHGPWKYHVQKTERREGRDAWRVEVSNNYGWQRKVWVDRADTGAAIVALAAEQREFMGMGQEYVIQSVLKETQTLSGEAKEAWTKGLPALVGLREKLSIAARSEELQYSPKQLALLQDRLPEVQELIVAEPLVKLVKGIRRDLVTQSDRAGSLEKLAAERQGKPAPDFKLSGLAGAELSHSDLKGQVTVLHFWDYSDTPLKQPYGQVGYLEFLYGKRKADGVKVYGVAVNRRLAEAGEKDGVVRGARRLVNFMNLTYPVLLDDGQAIKAFGDPRLLGAELPLYVVIGADGKVAHYKAGYYEVDRLEGLKELNAVLGEQLPVKKATR
jgi:peroxiredoxin